MKVPQQQGPANASKAQAHSAPSQSTGDASASEFQDLRPEAAAQLQLKNDINAQTKNIQRVVNEEAIDCKVDQFSVQLKHEPARTDGYNFRMMYQAKFRDDMYHHPGLLEFRQLVKSHHEFKEPGRANLTVHTTDWHDDGYSRKNDSQCYSDNGCFLHQDLPGTNGMNSGITNIKFEFESIQQIVQLGTGKVIASCTFPKVVIQGPDLANLVTTPSDGTKAEMPIKKLDGGDIPEEAFSGDLDF